MINSHLVALSPFDKLDSDLRIEALRQAVDLWKHWGDNGEPPEDETLVSVARSLHKFLAGSPE